MQIWETRKHVQDLHLKWKKESDDHGALFISGNFLLEYKQWIVQETFQINNSDRCEIFEIKL
jgi:hypothetical protein